MEDSISLPDDNGEKYLIIRTTSLNITEDMSTSFHFIPFIFEVILDTTCLFGMACNIMSMLIFNRKPMKSLQSLPHIFLATFDTLFLFSLFAKDIVGGCPAVTGSMIVLGKTAWTCSVWLTLWLFAKFYVDISSQRMKLLDNNRGVVCFHLLILLFAICFNIPHFCLLQHTSWKTSLQSHFPCYYGRHVLQNTPSLPHWLRRHELFFEIWCTYLDTAVMFCVPLFFCIIFCIYSQLALKRMANVQHETTQHQETEKEAIIQHETTQHQETEATIQHETTLHQETEAIIQHETTLHQESEKQATIQHETTQHQEKQLGHLGITYGILFVFFSTYSSVLAFAVPYYYGFLPACMHAVVDVSYVLVCMNSAVKFAIYCALGKEFRRTLRNLMWSCVLKEAMIMKNILRKFDQAKVSPGYPTEC